MTASSLHIEPQHVKASIVFQAIASGDHRARKIGAMAKIRDERNSYNKSLAFLEIMCVELRQQKCVSTEYLDPTRRPHQDAGPQLSGIPQGVEMHHKLGTVASS